MWKKAQNLLTKNHWGSGKCGQEKWPDISECRKQILYLEAYSRRENVKFEGIPESFETSAQQSASAEDTRKVLVNLFWRRSRYRGPRILCAKHGSPITGKSFIVSFRFVEYQKPWIKTEVLFLFMFHIELLFIFPFITCHSLARILRRVKFKNFCGFAVCSVLFFFYNLALKFQLFVYAFIFSLKKWGYLKNERVLLYSKTARLVGFSSPSLSLFLIKKLVSCCINVYICSERLDYSY